MLIVFAFLIALIRTTKETTRWLQETKWIKSAKLVLQWLRDEEYDVDKEQKEVAELQEKGRIFCRKIIRVQHSNPIWLFLQDFV